MAVQIQVQDDTWNRLKNRKVRPSQFFDDIIRSALDAEDRENEQ